MGTWLLSIFGQLQLELYSVSQEGMRKLEIKLLNKLKYPNFNEIEHTRKERLKQLFYTEQAIVFTDIRRREIDHIWAEIISKEPGQLLNEAFEIFDELIDNRIGWG